MFENDNWELSEDSPEPRLSTLDYHSFWCTDGGRIRSANAIPERRKQASLSHWLRTGQVLHKRAGLSPKLVNYLLKGAAQAPPATPSQTPGMMDTHDGMAGQPFKFRHLCGTPTVTGLKRILNQYSQRRLRRITRHQRGLDTSPPFSFFRLFYSG